MMEERITYWNHMQIITNAELLSPGGMGIAIPLRTDAEMTEIHGAFSVIPGDSDCDCWFHWL
jgi:hypothetical protein